MSAQDDAIEEWRAVPGYEGSYEASDMGRVKSLARAVANGSRAGRKHGGRILKSTKNRSYLKVGLWRDGKRTNRFVHDIVLRTFAGPPPSGMECCHGPGGKLDNRLSELRWGTRKSNAADRDRDGTSNHGERNGSARLREGQVIEIYQRGDSVFELAREFAVGRRTIYDIKSGQTWGWLTGHEKEAS